MISPKRITFLCHFVIFYNILAFCQKDTLPLGIDLFKSLSTFYDQKTASELAEYEIQLKSVEKSPWMKFAPQIGFQTGFDLIPRPTLNFSLNQVYQVKNEREKQKLLLFAKIEAVKLQNAVQFANDSFSLASTLERLEIAQNAIESQRERRNFEVETLRIQNARYEAKLITDLELIESKRKYFDFEALNARNVETVELLKIEAKNKAKWRK